MDALDELIASYDPIDYVYTVYEKPNPNEEERKRMFSFIPTEEECRKIFFLNKDLFDDGLSGEAQADYFSHARRFMQSTVFQSVVEVGQNNDDLKILKWLKSDTAEE